jgi:hypothetical protein
MSTDEVAPPERAGYWGDWIDRLFHGSIPTCTATSASTVRMSTLRAGEIVLTRLEANRHRVIRPRGLARSTEVGYLKIVAPTSAAPASSSRAARRGSHPTSGASTTRPTATRSPTRCGSST